jgi:hypothetical protein
LGFKSDFLGNKRIIWEKIGLFGKNRIIWEKNRIIWEKIGFFGKNWIFWEKIRFFDYAIIFFSSVFPLVKIIEKQQRKILNTNKNINN